MAKDRNTIAKRQRELEKKRKAEQKRERRARKKQQRESGAPEFPETRLSTAEKNVLSAFRSYLMTPGKMLCFANSDLQAMHVPLTGLTDKGLLVAERFHGGYSLTEFGYAAMNGRECSPSASS
jgi:hypothetical protein